LKLKIYEFLALILSKNLFFRLGKVRTHFGTFKKRITRFGFYLITGSLCE
jgi:hypothetical protein